MHYKYRTAGVCAQMIEFDVEDNKIHNVNFFGGCNGNLKAIGKLVEGADAMTIADTLEGNICGMRGTSCADQFSKAIKEALSTAQA